MYASKLIYEKIISRVNRGFVHTHARKQVIFFQFLKTYKNFLPLRRKERQTAVLGADQIAAVCRDEAAASMPCVAALIAYLKLSDNAGNINGFTFGKYELSRYMKLDLPACEALNLFPVGATTAATKQSASDSLYSLLNRCQTTQVRGREEIYSARCFSFSISDLRFFSNSLSVAKKCFAAAADKRRMFYEVRN